MKYKLFSVLLIFALALTVFVPFGSAQTQTYLVIEDADFNDSISPNSILTVEATLLNMHEIRAVEKLEIKAWLENAFGERVSDKATISGLVLQAQGERNVKLKISIPANIMPGTYTLKIIATGKLEKSTEKVSAEYTDQIDIEAKEDSLFISNIELSKNEYRSGDNVDLAITVINNGLEDQDNVVVSISVPELGVTKSIQLLGPLYSGTSQTVYFTFVVPKNTDSGIYTIRATAADNLVKTSRSATFVVKELKEESKYSTLLVTKELRKGQSTEISFKVVNSDSELKNYTISFVSTGLSASIVPTSFSLLPGQSKVLTAKITASDVGQQIGEISVFENGNTISVLRIVANITDNYLTPFAITFIVLVLLIVAIIIYREYKFNNNKPKLRATAYY
ncbi:MAG: hypothetical protein ACP5JY_02920 [Candidatus Nanoarchaeia archaeon]